MNSVHHLSQGELVAIDGKTLRGSYNCEERNATIRMFSADTAANRLVLGQLKADKNSNEIIAIPELLKRQDLRGLQVSIDAIACQTKFAKAIAKQCGDYLLAVKSNQSKLANAVQNTFSEVRSTPLETRELQAEVHHRRMKHVTAICSARMIITAIFSRWQGLKTIAMAEHFRVEKDKSVQVEYRYYICSKEMAVAQVANTACDHWAIESMHWIPDVSMQKDACLIYKDNAAENLACLRAHGTQHASS